MSESPESSYSPEVITTYVWDAIKDIAGVADLYRSPMQTLGEKVHLERHRPVRLELREGGSTLDVHIVIAPRASVPAVVAAMRREVGRYLEKMTSIRLVAVNVFVDDIAAETPNEG